MEITAVQNPPTVKDKILGKRGSAEINNLSEKLENVDLNNGTMASRIVDIVLSVIGLVSLGLVFPFFGLGIKINSSGPVFFKQKRTGLNGVEFGCYKFRTMHLVDLKSEVGKPVVTKKGDKRIFRFGSFLRKTNLDELPQLINVLKGEMSLVGPRPYPVEECRHWNNVFDDFYYRYLVKPGITGLAQVSGFRGGNLDEEHMRERLDKDLSYVENKSFSLDIKIIYSTIIQMLMFKTNAH